MLGGSAVHFSLAASFFTDVRVVGPVGDDFGDAEYGVLRERGVDTSDIERVAGGRTFFWAGQYGYDLNTRETLDTQLGVFGEFDPKLSDESRAADMLFLGNIQPDLQREVRRRLLRRGVHGLPGGPWRRGGSGRGGAAAGDDLRVGARVVQRGGVRDRSGAALDARRDRPALRGVSGDHLDLGCPGASGKAA